MQPQLCVYFMHLAHQPYLGTFVAFFENYFLFLANGDPKHQFELINQTNMESKFIGLDTMDFWMQIALDDLLAVIKEIDVLTINDEEARLLSGESSLKKAANKILTMGPSYLIIKKGEHGALLFDKNNNVFSAPALLLEEVFDPTGAGDTFLQIAKKVMLGVKV